MDKPGAFAKCTCCNNPWQLPQGNDAEGDRAFGFCAPCKEKGENRGLDPNNIDEKYRAQDNFYLYSNGRWKDANPCPPAYPRWGVFNVLNESNQERLKTILGELEMGSAGGDEQDNDTFERGLLINYHQAFMDVDRIERDGISPLVNVIDSIQNMKADTMVETVAELWKSTGIGAFFGFYAMPSKDDSSHTLLNIVQGGLGLPDRDYYFEKVHEDKREKYIMYLEAMFKLLGEKGCIDDLKIGEPYKSAKGYRDAAKAVFDFERELAGFHMSRTECRDPEKTWNKLEWSALISLLWPKPSWSEYLTQGARPAQRTFFDISNFFTLIGFDPSTLGLVNITNVEALQSAVKLACPGNLNAIRHYLVARHLKAASPYISQDFFSIYFDFFDKEMSGTKEMKERWKMALDHQMEDLPDAMGKLYVDRYFDKSCKEKALNIVYDVKEALRKRLHEVEWMSAETRKHALEKMEAFNCKIGYPDDDAWVDYSSLKGQIIAESPLANHHKCQAHNALLLMKEVNKPTNRSKWLMPCQMINAYYHPMLNEIVFPAAILQPPFFDPDADDAVQFGSLGCIAGHEMTHGFDDKGRKFDSKGTLRDWWVGEDGKEYDRRAKVMIDQANAHKVFDQNLKGELTVGENIADLGGVKLALRALKEKLGAKSPELVNGLNPIQRFCLSWSQVWRQNATREHQLKMVTLDPHGPSELRVNNTLSNVSDFYEEFQVKEGDSMFIAPSRRVDIW